MEGLAPFPKAPLGARSQIALGRCAILWATQALLSESSQDLTASSGHVHVYWFPDFGVYVSLYCRQRPCSSLPHPVSPNLPTEPSPPSPCWLILGWSFKEPRDLGWNTACAQGSRQPHKTSTHPATHPSAWGHSEAEQTPLMKRYNFSKLMRRRRWPEPTGMNPKGQQAEEISPRFPHKLTEVTLARVWIFLASSLLQLYTWLGLICYLCQLCIFVKFKGLLPWPDLAKSELTCGSLVAISF